MNTKISTKIAKAFVIMTKKLKGFEKIGNTEISITDGLAVMRVKDTNVIVIDSEGYTHLTLDSKVAVDRVNGYLKEINAEALLDWHKGKPYAWTGEWTEIDRDTSLNTLTNLAYA